MSIERNLLISLLKLTKSGPALIESVNIDAHIPSSTMVKLLEKLQSNGMLYLKGDVVEVESGCRIKLGVQAVSLGADLEHISNLLCWQEFEEITALALRDNGFSVSSNVRFKNASRKWEIDAVACRKPLVICIDCKHWQHSIVPSALKKIVDSQTSRTIALMDCLPSPILKIKCTKWEHAKFIPVILSLLPCTFKFYNKVPVVPILQIQDFLNQLSAYTDDLKFFPKTFNSLT